MNATSVDQKCISFTINNDTKFVDERASYFSVELWDHAAEDGDIVSVYLNGEWLKNMENFSLLNAKTQFLVSRSKLKIGDNQLVVFAQNEGSVGANTASIAINGSQVQGFSPGLHTGEAVNVRVQ